LRYQNNNWAVAARAEYYKDRNGVIVRLVNATPFKMQGYSINIDRMIANRLLWRVEGRLLKNSVNYFTGQPIKPYNLSVTASISFSFN
jgi:hypothetical protein